MVSVSGAVINLVTGTETSNSNTLIMFGLCIIASVVLLLHKLFDECSPMMTFLQYAIVIGKLIRGIRFFCQLDLEKV